MQVRLLNLVRNIGTVTVIRKCDGKAAATAFSYTEGIILKKYSKGSGRNE